MKHPHDVLAPTLNMGPVSLNVRDIGLMKQFYAGVVGLEAINETAALVTLGWKAVPIITLHATPELPVSFASDAGLYHLAIVFSSRSDLAHAVARVLTQVPRLFSGSADHLVSEAFYLSDPEGNGIELYYDRDASLWEWDDAGMVRMASDYIAPQEYIPEHAVDADRTGTAKIGHVHLKVGSIRQAQMFYINTLGFSVTAQMPEALFASVNRYHHHLGMNTWHSEIARPRQQTLGLRDFSLILPSPEDLIGLRERLDSGRVRIDVVAGNLVFDDPWNNRIVASAPRP